jgi:hypothetical protein
VPPECGPVDHAGSGASPWNGTVFSVVHLAMYLRQVFSLISKKTLFTNRDITTKYFK